MYVLKKTDGTVDYFYNLCYNKENKTKKEQKWIGY